VRTLAWTCLWLAAFALSAASAQAVENAAPDPSIVNAYRVAARARAALDLLTAGRPDAAITQVAKAEQGPLERAGDARAPLAQALARLRSGVDAGDSGSARAAADAAVRAANRLPMTLPEAGGAAGGAGAVVAALARDAGGEGQEAAAARGDDAVEPRAYALALCAVAAGIADDRGLPGTVADALDTLATTIGNRADVDAVRAATATVLGGLGAAPAPEDVTRAFRAIDRGLDLAVSRYRQGDAAGAQEALIDAYLDDFEGLEPALRSADPALEQRLEATLAQHLRGLIREGVPAARLADAVEQARTDLAAAREALR